MKTLKNFGLAFILWAAFLAGVLTLTTLQNENSSTRTIFKTRNRTPQLI